MDVWRDTTMFNGVLKMELTDLMAERDLELEFRLGPNGNMYAECMITNLVHTLISTPHHELHPSVVKSLLPVLQRGADFLSQWENEAPNGNLEDFVLLSTIPIFEKKTC